MSSSFRNSMRPSMGGLEIKASSAGRMESDTELNSEEFLFHLYRGTELLQDNLVHEAKEELEHALRLQPLDPKGQDLLAVTYFRLGLYPRAIEIFERLISVYPKERSPRLNLALCYLKTGQSQLARQLLEETVQHHPDYNRAWSYLGLAYEQGGDYHKAREAFRRGQQEGMAKRMEELIGQDYAVVSSIPSAKLPTAVEPFEELQPIETGLPVDHSEEGDPLMTRTSRPSPANRVPLSRPAPEPEPELEPVVPPPAKTLRRHSVPVHGPSVRPSLGTIPPPGPASLGVERGSVPPPSLAPHSVEDNPMMEYSVREPDSLAGVLGKKLIVFPEQPAVSTHESGLVRVWIEQNFSCRIHAIRTHSSSLGGGFQTQLLYRKARGKVRQDRLGGEEEPFIQLTGRGYLLLGSPRGRRLSPMTLNHEYLYLRESYVVAFEDTITYESGRLALGDGDSAAVMQLHGRGVVVIEEREQIAVLEVDSSHVMNMPRDTIIGWTGRLLPRAIPPSESLGGLKNTIAFSGEGVILIRVTLNDGSENNASLFRINDSHYPS
jgi:uncharacterized protein (AIM24 family)